AFEIETLLEFRRVLFRSQTKRINQEATYVVPSTTVITHSPQHPNFAPFLECAPFHQEVVQRLLMHNPVNLFAVHKTKLHIYTYLETSHDFSTFRYPLPLLLKAFLLHRSFSSSLMHQPILFLIVLLPLNYLL